jgi:predicted metalloprotease with PDZ domain
VEVGGRARRHRRRRSRFAPVSLTTLVDSPVLTGRISRFTLTRSLPSTGSTSRPTARPRWNEPRARGAIQGALVAETGALYGSRHYRHYDFLLTLSDHTAHFGLEHHESSDDRVDERSLIDADRRKMMAGLLPHEMTHS